MNTFLKDAIRKTKSINSFIKIDKRLLALFGAFKLWFFSILKNNET